MFWALAQREKDIEKGREKGREEGREEGREYERQRIERVLRESGVEIPTEVIREISAKRADGNQR